MAERVLSPATYATVLGVLLVLTCLTVSVSFFDLGAPVWHIAVGLTIAVCKASLVVLFFMHALYSSRLTWAVIAVAVFWLGFFLVLTLSDYFTRGLLPYPGH
jgi:cytochrome c oxidase subunit IV